MRAEFPQKLLGAETDFLSLDSHNKIGYNGMLKLGGRKRLPGTLCCNAGARRDPLPRMCHAGRKTPNGAGCAAEQAAGQDAVVTSQPSTFDLSTPKN